MSWAWEYLCVCLGMQPDDSISNSTQSLMLVIANAGTYIGSGVIDSAHSASKDQVSQGLQRVIAAPGHGGVLGSFQMSSLTSKLITSISLLGHRTYPP